MSLRARMGVAAGVAVAVAVMAVAISAYLGTRSQIYGEMDNSLTSLSQQYTSGPVPGPRDSDLSDGRPGGEGNGLPQSGASNRPFQGDCDGGLGINAGEQPFGGLKAVTQLLRPSGSICRSVGQKIVIPVTPAALRVARAGRGHYFTSLTVRDNHIRVLVAGVPGGYGAVMLALPLAQADSTLSHELLLMLGIAAGGIALAALLGILVARTAVAPIARFTRQAERIAEHPGRLERERLQVTSHDELARLAHTFNQTLDALEQSIIAQRNLVADASHELRTPISTLRANLQLLRDEVRLPVEDREAIRTDMIEELDELTRLVGDVVELARGSKGPDAPGDVRLDHVVGEALERARRRGPQLQFSAELEPTLVRGEGERIARAVTNLLDNAIKWSPAGGTVEVSLGGGVVSVRDHGPGFHDEDLPFVFDRFHRARDARAKPGSGLGLAIVRQAAEAHGGSVEAANAPGGGALMRVSFGRPQELGSEPAPAQGERAADEVSSRG